MIKTVQRVARILEIAQRLASEAPIEHRRSIECHIENIQIADYSEPGYSGFAVFGNWNDVDTYDRVMRERVRVSTIPSRLEAIFSRMGIECEWSDQWTTCHECGRMFESEPTSYWWKMSGEITEQGCYCHECKEQPADDESEDESDDDSAEDTDDGEWLSREERSERFDHMYDLREYFPFITASM